MKRVLLLPTVFLLLLGAVFFAATADFQPKQTQIVFGSEADIKHLDPHAMSWMQDIRAAMALWEGLLAYDPKTLSPIPGTAESYTVSPDGLVYTFHLRPNARWSNGDPVTAQDFIATWQRALNPRTGTEYRDMFFTIKGAKAYNDAMAAYQKAQDAPATSSAAASPATRPSFETVGLRAPDERTLIVTLQEPCGYFPDLVAFTPFYPLHFKSMAPFLLDPKNPDAGYRPEWTHPPHLVTNGPFVLTEWAFRHHLTFEPNPQYWDRAHVLAPRIRHVAYEQQEQAGYLAYSTGVVDILSFVPSDFAPELVAAQRAGKRHDVRMTDSFGTYYYVINCTRPPLDDPRVRKAFDLVIDKRQIVDHVTRMHQKPITTLVPPESIPGYKSPAGLAQNVALARQLLAEAGYPGGKGLREIELLYNNAGTHLSVAQAVGQMWQRDLGVQVRFRGVEQQTFSAERRASNFDIARGGWYGDYTDPTTWLDLARTGNPNNNGKYADPAFDKILDAAAAEPNPAKRFAILQSAEKRLVEETMPFIPLYQYSNGYLYNPEALTGCEPNTRLLLQFKYMHRP